MRSGPSPVNQKVMFAWSHETTPQPEVQVITLLHCVVILV